MPQPETINRNIGQVSPTNYVNPGVQDNSTAALVGAVGGAALSYDKAVQTRQLDEELEGLRTQWVTKASEKLSPEDRDAVAQVEQQLQKGKTAVEQGIRGMTWDGYRIRGESILRTAIARRPGLAEEFRRVASNTLGTDVVGATALFLAEQEKLAGQVAEEKDTRNLDQARKEVEMATGQSAAALTADQVFAIHAQPNIQDAITANMRLMQEVELGERLVKKQDQGATLHAGQRMAVAVGALGTELYPLAQEIATFDQALQNGGAVSPADLSGFATTTKLKWTQAVSKWRVANTQLLTPAQMDEVLAPYAEFMTHLDKLASGQFAAENADVLAKTAVSMAQLALARDPVVAQLSAMRNLMPEAMTQVLVQEQGPVRDGVIAAAQAALTGQYTMSGEPDLKVATTFAGTAVDLVADDFVKQSPEEQAKAIQIIAGLPSTFSRVPTADYRFGNYAAMLQRVHLIGAHVNRAMPDEQKVSFANDIGQATAVYLQNLRTLVDTNASYATLRDQLDVSLHSDGSMMRLRPGVSVDAKDKALFNSLAKQHAVGSHTLDLLQQFGGYDKPAAVLKVAEFMGRPKPKNGQASAAGVSLGNGMMRIKTAAGTETEVDQEGYETYSPVATAAAEKHGIPSNVFLSLIAQESKWKADAKSGTGVRGLAQVTRATASGEGFSGEDYTTPENQIAAGASYLAKMYKKYGDWNLAVAAYNSGPGHLDRFLRTGEKRGNFASGQTQDYVVKVLGFDEDLLEYGREVMGIVPPEERDALASTAKKEREGQG